MTKSFAEFLFGENGVQAYIRNQDYAGAWALIEAEGDPYFADFGQILSFHKTMVCAYLEDASKTCQTLQTALDNHWFLPRMAFDPYNQPPIPPAIEALPEFQALLAQHEAGWQHLLATTPPLHASAAPENSENPPLVIGFHGNNSSIAIEFDRYEPLAQLGYRVVMPQSAQPWAKNRFVWGDWANTEKQVAREWQVIQEKYLFSQQQIVTVGLSKGGEVAIWAAISGTVPAIGVIGIGVGCPMMDNPDRLEPYLAHDKAQNLRFYFLLGEKDHFAPKATQATAAYLEKHGLQVHLEMMPELGHALPNDVSIWQKALAFIHEKH